MRQRALSGSGGGGLFQAGTLTISDDNVSRHETLGFKPKKLVIYFIGNTSNDYPTLLQVYDEDILSGYTWRSINTGSNKTTNRFALPDNNILENVDSTGFTYCNNASYWVGTAHYIAVG